ncbi:MAG: gamma-glutamyltransferase family protein [Candidatus Hydrogenedentes bacterium]|nr:gamma-glutamyltransferase family protein [Candidatus Hydrogenedentota bacterium]
MNRREFLAGIGAVSLGAAFPPGGSAWTEDPALTDPAKGTNRENVLRRNQNRSTVIGRSGMVCASHPLATLAGLNMLQAGGNAVDAAVSANAMLGLVEPMNCGPGGDLFAILWIEKEQKLFGLNASGRAPRSWNLDEAKDLGMDSIPPYSPLAWNVPGCVGGWEALLGRFGSMKPAALLEPAIRHARDGFPLSSIIADEWGFDPAKFPSLATVFAPEGRPPRYGEVFRNPDLADFYGLIAREGLRAFYEGEPAERIVRHSKAVGGRFSAEDFRENRPAWVEPVSTNYRGFDVWEIPPNGQGISVLQMLNMLETFDIGGMKPNSAEQIHLFIEAKKLAWEDRSVYYADMDFAEVPLERLVSKDYGRKRAKLIDPKRAAGRVAPGDPVGSDTVYLTTADSEGNMVSLIQSIYHGWGSHLVPEGLGFALQNRGMSFSLDPAHRNRLEPGKRPFHTIIPAFVTREGRPVFSFGVMGGDFQPQGHVQVLMNLLDFGMSPQQAGEQPRVQHAGGSSPQGRAATRPGMVTCEPLVPEETRARLAEMGHKISKVDDTFGGYQGIWREEDPRRYFGGSDPRKDGCAMGC